MRLVLLRYLHFICIFMDAIKSELLTLTFQSDIVRIWVHIKLSLSLLQSKRLNKLRFTPLSTTVYLSHLPSPTPSHNLSSGHFPKCIRNKGCFISFTRDCKKNNKEAISECWNRKWYSCLYQYKTSFSDRSWLHTLQVKP